MDMEVQKSGNSLLTPFLIRTLHTLLIMVLNTGLAFIVTPFTISTTWMIQQLWIWIVKYRIITIIDYWVDLRVILWYRGYLQFKIFEDYALRDFFAKRHYRTIFFHLTHKISSTILSFNFSSKYSPKSIQ